MREKRALLVLHFLLALLLCTEARSQSIPKIYVNPKNPAIQKQSAFVDSLHFVPFENKEGVSFENGFARPAKKYYFVTDFSKKMLYFYSKSGTFVKKVDFSRIGTNLYPAYRPNTDQIVFFGDNPNYSLTPKDRIEILLDWSNKRNLKYFRKYVIDLADTSFTIRKTTPDKHDLTGAYPFYGDRHIQVKIATSNLYPDSIGYELRVYANDTLVNAYFPYNRINEPRFLFSEENVAISLSDTPYISYVARPFCDTIYRLVKDNLSPACQIVLPLENSLPASFFSNPFKSKTDKENFTRNNGWVMREVYGFYETPRLLFFQIAFFQRFEFFVYDKQAGVAYNVSKIKPDAQQYNLSLLTPQNYREGNRFYKVVKAEALITFFKQNPGVSIPQELSAFLQKNPDKNTPVVVEYVLKK